VGDLIYDLTHPNKDDMVAHALSVRFLLVGLSCWEDLSRAEVAAAGGKGVGRKRKEQQKGQEEALSQKALRMYAPSAPSAPEKEPGALPPSRVRVAKQIFSPQQGRKRV
jgi:hypothetical protein